jgi:hypothetical protein
MDSEDIKIWTGSYDIEEKYLNKISSCDLDSYFEEEEKYKTIENDIDEIIKYSSFPKLLKKQKIDITSKCNSIKQTLYDDIADWHDTCELLHAKLNESIYIINKLTQLNTELINSNYELHKQNIDDINKSIDILKNSIDIKNEIKKRKIDS